MRKGSIHATQASRDSHVDRHKDRDQAFHDLAESYKGSGLFRGRRKSSAKGSELGAELDKEENEASPKKGLKALWRKSSSNDSELDKEENEASPKKGLKAMLSGRRKSSSKDSELDSEDVKE
jgi:hypothetical protein